MGPPRTSGSPIVDAHAHFVDLGAARDAQRAAPELAPVFAERDGAWQIQFPGGDPREVPLGLVDEDERLAYMDREGIDVHALSGWSALFHYRLPAGPAAELIAYQNDGMLAACRRHPDRLLAMPGLPMQDAALAVQEIERMARHREVVAIAVGSHVDGRNLDDPALEPIWEALAHQRLPVLVHPPGMVAGAERLSRYYLTNLLGNPIDTTIAVASIVCSGVLDRHPGLRFGFVHGGGFAPYQAGRLDHGWRVRPETRAHVSRPPSSAFGEALYFDSLTHDGATLRFLGTRWGWDRVYLGSDYPFDMQLERPLAALSDAGLETEEVQTVASDTPRAFLRWPWNGDAA